MRVTWNGTGSAWSRLYGNASAVVESGGKRLLIDCGHTVPSRLEEIGLTLRDIDAVFISHLHGDHIYGLEEWGFKNFLVWNARPTLFVADAIADMLWTDVLAGTMAQVCNRSCLLNDYFDVVRLREREPATFGSMTVEIHPVLHVPNAPAFGAKVAADGKSVGFTCDSLADVSPWFYDGTSVVFHDCSLAPPFPETVHAHFSELRRYPEDWRKRTRLVHYGDEWDRLKDDPSFISELSATGMEICPPRQAFDI
jgi:hypothetical protein